MKENLSQGEKDRLKALYPQMFSIGEVYLGAISEINNTQMIIEFGGAEGIINLADYQKMPTFMINTEVEVRITDFTQYNEILLTFTSKYRRQHFIVPRTYEGEVIQSSHSAIAIYIPELKRAGIRRPDKLKRRYQMMSVGQRIKCFAIKNGYNLNIYKVSAIIRDGKEIPTYDADMVAQAVAAGSEKSYKNFLLGYIYEAVVGKDDIFISETKVPIRLKDAGNYAEGDLLEIRLSFINPHSNILHAVVVSVLQHKNEQLIETEREIAKTLELDHEIYEQGIKQGSEIAYQGFELGKLYKAKVMLIEGAPTVIFADKTKALVAQNSNKFQKGSSVWARVTMIDSKQNIPFEVKLEQLGKN